jgi:hypothetical protein
MALAVRTAATPSRAVRLPGWLGGVGVISVCVAAFVALVPPALAVATPGSAPEAVTVRLTGELSTAGLPDTPAVSRLSIHNMGPGSVSWSARASISGVGASGVHIDSWLPGAGPCIDPMRTLTGTGWSLDPVPPGGTIDICVRVTASETSRGTATPHVTVVARPAES